MLADTHTHTYLCKHADGLPLEYLNRAATSGLGWLGVSDHFPWPDGFDAKWRMFAREYPQYKRMVADLKNYGSRYGVEVLYGVEIDYAPGRMDEVRSNLDKESYDYVIGSVHYEALDNFPIDNPEDVDKWTRAGGPDVIWPRYAKSMLDFVSAGGFDVIGHIDLPKKFGFYPSDMKPFLNIMREVMEAAAAKGIAVELNTAGLRKKAKEIYPSPELLKLARKEGVEICFGSDAHAPEEVGMDFDKAVALAKEAGYESWTLFRGRERSRLPLPS